VGIILLTVLVVFGSCNSNTNVSLVGTSPQLFDVCQVSSGNPDYRNRELFINELEKSVNILLSFKKIIWKHTLLLNTRQTNEDILLKKKWLLATIKKSKR
jgi:hypothetical protein